MAGAHLHGRAGGSGDNSKRHIFVYTRTGSVNVGTGTSRTFVRGGTRLFEFDQNGTYVREIGQDIYGFVWGDSARRPTGQYLGGGLRFQYGDQV